MDEMLQRLLSIQGATEQLTFDTAPADPAPAPAGSSALGDPGAAAHGTTEDSQQAEERGYWRDAYNLYAEYESQLTAAAAAEDYEKAGDLFTAALDTVQERGAKSKYAETLYNAVYGLLEIKYNEAKAAADDWMN